VTVSSLAFTVRYLKRGPNVIASTLKAPFVVEGASNVFLETIKRGENDNFGRINESSTTTVILRFYEAFGGHAQARLKIDSHFPVSKAYVTNLMEDEDEELNVMLEDGASEELAAVVKLDFHGFEVKTVKLVIGDVLHSGQE